MRIFPLLTFFIAGMLVSGCSAFSVINAASPSSSYTLEKDIAYGSNDRQQLDVYVPRSVATKAPLVVFFYGGGWNRGSKDSYRFVAASLTRAGYVTVIPDYRLYPKVAFPLFVEDAAAATAWAVQHAAEYGADADRIYLMGHSAGAQIAALLSLDQRYLEARGVASDAVAGFVGLSGPYDFLPLKKGYLNEVFPEESRAQSQAINFASASAPRSLLIHGEDDDVVEAGNSRRLADALDAAGVPVILKIYEDLGHASIAAALAPPLNFIASTIDDVISFIGDDAQVAETAP